MNLLARLALSALVGLVPLAPSQADDSESAAARLEAMQAWATRAGYAAQADGPLLVFQEAGKALSPSRGKASRGPLAVPVSDIAAKARELWGGEGAVQDEPVCLFILRNGEEMRSLNEMLAALPGCQYLSGFVEESATCTSFLHREPLVGGILQAPDGVEEWSLAHESTSFGGRLLLLRRFGPVPLWVELGCGLRMQEEVQGEIYSYPYRAGFVGIGDHGGWEKPLGRTFKGFARGRAEALELAQLAPYPRGQYDEERIPLLWGVWKYLRVQAPEALTPLLADLGTETRAGLRTETHHPDGSFSFTVNPAFRLPVQRQAELLVKHLGPDAFERLSLYFESGPRNFERDWKRYQSKRK